MIAYYEGREPNPDDLEVMDNLLIPFSEMVSVWQGRQNNFCLMQERQTVIDFRGRVSLCCMTYGEHSIVSPSFLDDPFEATLEAKRRHPTCKSCMAFGAHNMIDYYEDEAMQRLLSGKIEAVLGPQKSTVA
jgi:hypothetical protein